VEILEVKYLTFNTTLFRLHPYQKRRRTKMKRRWQKMKKKKKKKKMRWVTT
jgi:hypothetical protein